MNLYTQGYNIYYIIQYVKYNINIFLFRYFCEYLIVKMFLRNEFKKKHHYRGQNMYFKLAL